MRSRARASADRARERLAIAAAIKGAVGPAAYSFTDAELIEIVDRCHSVGLAIDALLMVPQPSWLGAIRSVA